MHIISLPELQHRQYPSPADLLAEVDPGRIQAGARDARLAFESWRGAESEAQAAERELLALMQGGSPPPEFMQSVRSKRAKAHHLLEAALREVKDCAASLHHRKILG